MNQEALDALRKEVIEAIYGQDDWLDSLTVAMPPSEEPQSWVRTVEHLLADLRLDCVDVSIAPNAHEAPWIRAFELKPGWA